MSRALFSFFLFFRFFFRELKTPIPKKKWDKLLHQLVPLLSSVVKHLLKISPVFECKMEKVAHRVLEAFVS